MQQSSSTTTKPENNCPDCLYMELKTQPPNPLRWFRPLKQIDIRLTINFSEQWEPVPFHLGRFKFGLKGGELRLKLENCEIPFELRELKNKLEPSIQKERKKQAGIKTQEARGFSLPKIEANFKEEETAVEGDRFWFVDSQVTTKGGLNNPAWVFKVATEKQVLEGSLKDKKLATMNVIEKPCQVEATFEVSPKYICITETEGLLSPDKTHTKKQRVTIDRLIINQVLKNKISPYISKRVLRYE